MELGFSCQDKLSVYLWTRVLSLILKTPGTSISSDIVPVTPEHLHTPGTEHKTSLAKHPQEWA